MDYAKKEEMEAEVRAVYLQDAAEQALMLGGEDAGELANQLKELQYELIIEFTKTDIVYYLEHRAIQPEHKKQRIRFSSDQAKLKWNEWKKTINSDKDKLKHIVKNEIDDTIDRWNDTIKISKYLYYYNYISTIKEKHDAKRNSDINSEREILNGEPETFRGFSAMLLLREWDSTDDILNEGNPTVAKMERWLLQNANVGKEDETKVVISYEELLSGERKFLAYEY